MSALKTVVIDNGTGYTKMGYAGNPEPTHYIPTVIADHVDKASVQISKLSYDQLDFHIGDEALKNSKTHQVIWPISSGIVKDWELMEKFWHRSIFDYLRCEPEDHVFILTEPPMNPPENRERIAEIMFETFNVAGLYIGVQAVLALYSSAYIEKINSSGSASYDLNLTGTVLDSGDGVTHIIPISDGYVIGSCIKHIPLAGRDITKFIMQMLRDRGENILPEDMLQVSKEIKEKYTYLSSGNLEKEFQKFDTRQENGDPSKKFKKHEFISSTNGQKYSIDVGYEQFLGPEMFFHPEFLDSKWRVSIDEAMDNAIQQCPIDTRRRLYENVVLSGGSTLVKDFDKRLERQLQGRVSDRLNRYKAKTNIEPKPIKVNVGYNPYQKYSVWQGGSLIATHPKFSKMYHSREQYLEEGPAIARHNAVFQQM